MVRGGEALIDRHESLDIFIDRHESLDIRCQGFHDGRLRLYYYLVIKALPLPSKAPTTA